MTAIELRTKFERALFASSLNGCSERALGVPSHLKEPCGEGAMIDPCSFGPLYDCQGLTTVGNEMVVASVPALLLRGRPSDIARFVSAIIINAVEAIPLDAVMLKLADVIIESLERALPIRIALDVSCAITSVALTLGVGAAVNHRDPNAIDWGFCHAVDSLVLQATTRLGVAISQVNRWHSCFFAAIAFAQPKSEAAMILASVRDGNQFAKTFAAQVYEIVSFGDKIGLHGRFSFHAKPRGDSTRRLGTFIGLSLIIAHLRYLLKAQSGLDVEQPRLLDVPRKAEYN